MVRDSHRYPALDSIRALAAMFVLTTHVAFQTGETADGLHGGVLARLDLGVAIFFVLSGFLLYLPWAKALDGGGSAPSTRRYLWRRVVRIVPAYWVAFVIVLLTLPASWDLTSTQVVTNALLLQQYVDGGLLPTFTQTWSLCVEVAFYLLLPLLALLVAWSVRRAGWLGAAAVLVALWAVSIAWNIGVFVIPGLDPSPMITWLPAHIGWFATGMALAVLMTSEHPAPSRARQSLVERLDDVPPVLVLLACLLVVASTPVAGPRLLVEFPDAWTALAKELLYAVLAGAIVALGVLARGRLAAALTWRPLRVLGTWSYSLFLLHLVVLELVLRVVGREPFTGGFLLVWLLTTVVSIAAAALSYVAVERPSMRALRDRAWGRAPSSTTVKATTTSDSTTPDRPA